MDSKIINPRQSLLERFMMHWLNLILKSDQGLVLRHRHKNLQKQSNQDSFTRLLNPCLHFTKSRFTIPMHIEQILKHLIILNPHTKLSFSYNNPYFYSIPPKNILQTDKFNIIRDFCGLIFNQDLNFLHKI